MSNDTREGMTRRQALVTAVGGTVAALAAKAADGPEANARDATQRPASDRMPVVFLPHGGGPWPFVEMGFGDPEEVRALATYLRSVRDAAPRRPRAQLVISAHWEEPVPTVMTAEHPPMLYDYYGFPPESYAITWPAPGDPRLAARVRELLGAAGFATAEDAARGFDHGTFVPLKLTWPEADVPTVQLSLKLARALVHLAGLDEPPRRWVAGADAVAAVEQKARDLLAQADAHRELSSSLDLAT